MSQRASASDRPQPEQFTWHKSSYSSSGGAQCVEVGWRTSSYSANGSGQCVEVTTLPATHGMRDTRNRDKAALFFTSREWDAFLTAAKNQRL